MKIWRKVLAVRCFLTAMILCSLGFASGQVSSPSKANSSPNPIPALKASINGPSELAYDRNGFLYIVEWVGKRLLRLDVNHDMVEVVLLAPKTEAEEFDLPNAVAVDSGGIVFVADFSGRLIRVDMRSGEVIVLLAGPKTPSAIERPLDVPGSIAIDPDGNLLITDHHHKLFRWRFDLEKLVTVAGTGVGGYNGDGILATSANLNFSEGVAVDGAGDIFIADSENCRIRKVAATTQVITTIAGNGECASKGDGGAALKAALNYPSSLAIDASGNLFFVETATDRVRRIDRDGIIATYAGSGKRGFSGDGGPATEAKLNNPSGIALDGWGNLFISEYVNNRVRRVDAGTQVITTVAGDGNPKRINTQE